MAFNKIILEESGFQMIGDKKVLALIPARGGSKGIKDKNIIDLKGKPLISYTIEAARASKYIDTVVVTTDSMKIKKTAEEFGAEVPFMRPKEYAMDKSATLEAVINAIEQLEKLGNIYDVLVLLQPTSPLRTNEDIDGALEKFEKYDEKSLVGVSKVEDNPVLIRRVLDETTMEKIVEKKSTVRRQDMEEYYRVNGSIYINRIGEIDVNTSFNDNVIPFIMDEKHSVDIDVMKDLMLAEYYLQ